MSAAVQSSPALRRAFRTALEASLTERRDATEERTEALREKLRALSRRLVTVDRQLVALAWHAQGLPGLDSVLDAADEALVRLLSLPRVQRIDIVDTTLLITSAPLQIAWNGARYQLGAYRVTLNLNGDIRVESIDKLGPKPGWDHPHVQDGRPCLGNVREGVLKLIAEYELALAVQIVLDFLEIYQADSAYCPIEEWPRIDVD